MERPTLPVLLNCTSYPLNKSKSKYISIGLLSHGSFAPIIVLQGLKGDWITFNESEWSEFLDNQGVISNVLYSKEEQTQPQTVQVGGKSAHFYKIGEVPVVTIKDISEVCFAFDSLCELWELLPIVENRIRLLKNLRFPEYYATVIKAVASLPGDFASNICKILQEVPPTNHVVCIRELLKFVPQIVEVDVDVEKRIQSESQNM